MISPTNHPLLGLGIIGNTLTFEIYLYTFVIDPEKRPVDFILIHLVFSNVVRISVGRTGIISAVYFKNFSSYVGLGRWLTWEGQPGSFYLHHLSLQCGPGHHHQSQDNPMEKVQATDHKAGSFPVSSFFTCCFFLSSNLLCHSSQQHE